MVIQTPGSFVWAGSLAVRLGNEGWSTWGVYLVTGCLQGCLLCMAVYFELQARKSGINLGAEVRFIILTMLSLAALFLMLTLYRLCPEILMKTHFIFTAAMWKQMMRVILLLRMEVILRGHRYYGMDLNRAHSYKRL